MKIVLLISCLLATTACVELESDAPEPPTTEPALATGGAGGGGTGGTGGDTLNGKETNGPWLLGLELDGAGNDLKHHLNVSRTGIIGTTSVAVGLTGYSSLTGTWGGATNTGADADFVGMQFPALPGPGDIEITSAVNLGAYVGYGIKYRTSSTAAWTYPCGIDGTAVVTAGRWHRNGKHLALSTAMTFACSDDGAIAKCIDKEYWPGFTSETSIGWRANVACTRALRADICGDGESHTRSGTYIDIYDRVFVFPWPPSSYPPITEWPPPPDEFHFDGAWDENGMRCGGYARWASLARGFSCPGKPDPRQDPSGEMCDDGTPLDGLALIETMAVFNELRMHEWQRGADRVVTVRGYHSPGTGLEIQPFDTGGWEYVREDAFLLRAEMDGLTSSMVTELKMWETPGGDHVVAPASPVAGSTDHGFEGKLLNAPRSGTLPFRRQTANANGTGDKANAAWSPAGYTPGPTLGHVIEP
jgi:hypothetical protein